jgi:hypothetical protein
MLLLDTEKWSDGRERRRKAWRGSRGVCKEPAVEK